MHSACSKATIKGNPKLNRILSNKPLDMSEFESDASKYFKVINFIFSFIHLFNVNNTSSAIKNANPKNEVTNMRIPFDASIIFSIHL